MIVQTQQSNPTQSACRTKRQFVSLISLALITLSFGCGAPPLKTDILDIRARAETPLEGEIQVSAVVLSPEETVSTFAVPLEKKGIQPVWLQIENQGDSTLNLMLISLDPDFTKDPYHAAGMRVVLLLGNNRLPIDDISTCRGKIHYPSAEKRRTCSRPRL